MSYDSHVDYPLNLLSKDIYTRNFEASKLRLDSESDRLCISGATLANVYLRDFVSGNCIVLYPSQLSKANFKKLCHTEIPSSITRKNYAITCKMDRRVIQTLLQVWLFQIPTADLCRLAVLPPCASSTNKE